MLEKVVKNSEKAVNIDIRICNGKNCFCTESNFVPPLKNTNKILCMVIGEAPGRSETIGKKPFIGTSGRLLNYLMNAANIDMSSLYITNTVKCRPPDNRKPTKQEIQICLPFLSQEISENESNKILVLGATALYSIRLLANLEDKSSIMSCAYTMQSIFINERRFELYIAPHPAFLIYKKEPEYKRFIDLLKLLQHVV